jgi:hypothetical protein
MRVVTLVIILLVLLVIGFVGASWYLHWQPIWGWYQSARGYAPAKTPEEAADRFIKALGERDYDTAADYCTGDGGYEFKKSADAGSKLAKAIDDLQHNIKLKEINSPKATWVLNRLQPMPKTFVKPNIKKINDTTAEFILQEDLGGIEMKDWADYTNIDKEMFRSMSGGLASPLALGNGTRITMVLEGDTWKLKLDLPTPLRSSMDKLRANSGNYVKALDKIKYEIKNHVVTKDELENSLKNELESAK